ncbi:MAG: chorismate mutase [Oscillospiraceae bacterium]|nr:chorismate mutase [Oscillospiraceae bacterium]
MNLEEARNEIRAADAEMAAQFLRRMHAVKEVAAYKREHGLPVFDREQEERVVHRSLEWIDDSELRDYFVEFLQNTMTVSRRYQHRLMDGMRIAYSGVEGAFAHIAAKRIFPGGTPMSYPSFEEAYNAVSCGDYDCAVLPMENSYAGEVGQVMDLMFSGSLSVNGIYDLRISQNLLGIPGAALSDIQTVVSHPQALGQCQPYLRRHNLAEKESSNTARAAKLVMERQDVHLAAIASAETAALYGLQILDRDINESKFNTTRFAVFSRAENASPGRRDSSVFLLMFTVRENVAGALAKAINVIGTYGFNMRVLRSRPLRTLPWQYYFYVEAEGDDTSENGRHMVEALRQECVMLKVVGRFHAGALEEGREETP